RNDRHVLLTVDLKRYRRRGKTGADVDSAQGLRSLTEFAETLNARGNHLRNFWSCNPGTALVECHNQRHQAGAPGEHPNQTKRKSPAFNAVSSTFARMSSS